MHTLDAMCTHHVEAMPNHGGKKWGVWLGAEPMLLDYGVRGRGLRSGQIFWYQRFNMALMGNNRHYINKNCFNLWEV